MGFDADAFRAARKPWTLVMGGTTYTAKPVSIAAVLDFKAAIDAAGSDEERAKGAVRGLLRKALPYRLHYRWRGDPVEALLADPALLQAALKDFFAHLAGMMGGPATSGTASPG